MNLKRLTFLALATYAMLAVWAISDVQESSPMLTIAPRQTITLQDLTPQQLADRAEELLATTTTSTTSTTVLASPRIAEVPLETKCQEWFPEAISVGWPNNTETLQKLGRLLWKETRCLNITPMSSDPELADRFNGHDHGVAQINEIHTKYVEQVFNMPFAEAMSDPTLNLRFAYLLYSDIAEGGGCGWKPWRLC
jgi:hypothetical protein